MLGLDLGRELGTLRLALGEGWAPMNDGLHAWMNDREYSLKIDIYVT